MKNTFYIDASIFTLLVISKLSSAFMNISPFIAIIIFSSYFINSKYLLLIMIFLSQAVSDFVYGIHITNLAVYMAYLIIVLFIYKLDVAFSFYNSIKLGLYTNFIFFIIANMGHYLAFTYIYTFENFFTIYLNSMDFTFNLVVSTILFLIIMHALLAISRKQLAKARSTKVS